MKPLALFVTVAAAVVIAIPIGLMVTQKVQVTAAHNAANDKLEAYKRTMNRLVDDGVIESVKCGSPIEMRLPTETFKPSPAVLDIVRVVCRSEGFVAPIEIIRPNWQPIETVY